MNKEEEKIANLYYRRGYIDGLKIAETAIKSLFQSIENQLENQLKKEENETNF